MKRVLSPEHGPAWKVDMGDPIKFVIAEDDENNIYVAPYEGVTGQQRNVSCVVQVHYNANGYDARTIATAMRFVYEIFCKTYGIEPSNFEPESVARARIKKVIS